MFCGNCGKELTGTPAKCSSCGARPMFGTRFCPECGAQTMPSTEVCVRCGARIEKEISEEISEGGMNKKKILGIIAGCVVGIIIGVFIAAWPSTPTQVNTYSKYGFSFEYPKAFSVTETGLGDDEANYDSGTVEFLWTGKACQVSWISVTPDEMLLFGGVENCLMMLIELSLEGIELSTGVANFEKGELLESTKAGHLMFYQYCTFTIEGVRVHAVVSCFYCESNQRVYTLTVRIEGDTTEEGVLEDFQNYLDSFVCH